MILNGFGVGSISTGPFRMGVPLRAPSQYSVKDSICRS